MAGNSKITELEILVRRIDEVQETYENLQYKLDRDIRDDLVDLLDRQISLLSGLIFDLHKERKISQADINKLLQKRKQRGKDQ